MSFIWIILSILIPKSFTSNAHLPATSNLFNNSQAIELVQVRAGGVRNSKKEGVLTLEGYERLKENPRAGNDQDAFMVLTIGVSKHLV